MPNAPEGVVPWKRYTSFTRSSSCSAMPAFFSDPSVKVLTIPPFKFASLVHRWVRLFVTAARPFEYFCQSSEFSMRCTLATLSALGTGRPPRSRVVIWVKVESSSFWKTSMRSAAGSVVTNALLGSLFIHKRGIGSIGAFGSVDTLPIGAAPPPPSGGAGLGFAAGFATAATVVGTVAGTVAGGTAAACVATLADTTGGLLALQTKQAAITSPPTTSAPIAPPIIAPIEPPSELEPPPLEVSPLLPLADVVDEVGRGSDGQVIGHPKMSTPGTMPRHARHVSGTSGIPQCDSEHLESDTVPHSPQLLRHLAKTASMPDWLYPKSSMPSEHLSPTQESQK
mmetsp:Transcript_46993/g.111864  ORF Transcript_46993/g.111864 Transcript_46993/m.111864 type:complete len:339 (+) Transcript_46993:504-1520(+)